MSTEAMKLALEALEWMVANDDTNEGDEPLDRLGGQSWNEYNSYWIDGLNNARASITALQEALAQPQQEPVACQYAKDVAMPEYRCVGRCQYDTSPPARKPLMDEEIGSCIDEVNLTSQYGHHHFGWHKQFARAIEAAHGIKEST